MARKYSTWGQCGSKKRYRSSKDALKVIRLRSKEIDYALEWYECPYCKGYHITKLTEGIAYNLKKYGKE